MSGMEPDVRILIILIVSPLVILTIHAVLARISSGLPQAIAVKSILLGYVPTALLLWGFVFRVGFLTNPAAAVFYCLTVYSSLAYTYFHFFNMSETARRIRILYEINRAGSLSSADIERLYKTTDIISIRLGRLVGMGQLKYEEGYYSINGKTLYLAGHAVLLWKRLLGLNG